jgi:hypothetical protein
MRNLVAALLLTAAFAPAMASAQAASPLPSGLLEHRVKGGTFTNPGAGHASPRPMSGQGCIASHINASQTNVNPITGKPQAAPIVSIPLTPNSGSIASATTRAQQSHACAHART